MRELIYYNDLIELSIIDGHSIDSILFLYKQKLSTQWRYGWLAEDLIKYIFNCEFKCLSSAGAILYEGIEIFLVLGSKSSTYSTLCSRGILGKLSGKASRNLLTIDTQSMEGNFSSTPLTVTKFYKYPLDINLLYTKCETI